MMSAKSETAPLVSVVLPAYNAGRYIDESLSSVIAQQGDFRVEIIVVDDGSTDDTRERVQRFPNVRLLSQLNAGPSAARNRGIAASNGEYVAFLDSDDLWTEGKLKAQMDIFRKHRNLGLVFGDCQRFNSSGPISESFFQESDLDLEFWGDPTRVLDPYAKLFRLNYIPTGAAVVRKQTLRVSGVFDESMRYVEDMDLWFRIAMHFEIGYTTHLCQLKRQHDDNVSNDTRIMDLAFVDVIDKQRKLYGKVIRRRRISMGRVAYRYCIIGDAYERTGQKGEARRWYLKALRTSPSLRALYYLAHTLWSAPTDEAA